MRVSLVCPYSLSVPGGVQGQVLGLARALRDLGVDARVVAPCDGPPPEPGVTSVGTTTRFVSNGSISPLAPGKVVARRTLEALRVQRPDVVHLHEPLCPGPTQAALLGTDVPIVGTFHAAGEEENPWYRAFRAPARRALRRVATRTAVSVEAQRLMEASFGGTYEVVPNAVEVARFGAADPWPSDRPAILFLGRHEPRKGLSVLLDAFAARSDGGLSDDAVLWVASDGPETEALHARADAGVEWLGRITDIEKARRLRGATVACFPSLRQESFGIVLLEAMAAGTAIVASDIPGYRSVARPDREAEGVAPGDADALRVALMRVLADPVRREQLVAAGRARADEFSMDTLARRFLAVYERAIEGDGA